MTAAYPKRPQFFAQKFGRLMAKVCLANELGTDACWMLQIIANTEDAGGYRKAVTFWNGQLYPLVGLGSESALRRLRDKVVAAGWLNYRKGAKGKAPAYFVTVPKHAEGIDDAPTDESGDELSPDSHQHTEQESGGNVNKKAPRKRRESEQHSSLVLTLEESPSESGVPPPRKPPEGPHHEAISIFTTRWGLRYGQKYPFSGGKDATAVKAMLAALGGDLGKFTAAVDRYLADPDPFYAGHGLSMMRSRLERWLVPPVSKPSSFHKGTAQDDYAGRMLADCLPQLQPGEEPL